MKTQEGFVLPAVPGVFLADGDHKFIGTNTGYGILIVTGDLVMLGSYTWEGLIPGRGDRLRDHLGLGQ